MQVDFDPTKSERNERDLASAFSSRPGYFSANTIEHLDSRADYGEERTVAIGRIESATVTVVYTWRAERRKYAAFFP